MKMPIKINNKFKQIIMDYNFVNTKEATNEFEISKIEKEFGFTFPEEYKTHILKFNGGHPSDKRWCFKTQSGSSSLIHYFYAVYDGKGNNFRTTYIILKSKGDERMPKNIVPIANDPFGNKICISVEGEDRGYIYFWDHENVCDEGEEPTYENLDLIAKSFNEFIENLTELKQEE
jgi:cell wall assembly regulator SMI1